MTIKAEVKIFDTDFWFMDVYNTGHSFTGEDLEKSAAFRGMLKVKGDYLHYSDAFKAERRLLGIPTGNTGVRGSIRVKGRYFYYVDAYSFERMLIEPIYPVPSFSGWTRHYDNSRYYTWDEMRAAAGNEVYYGGSLMIAYTATRAVEDKWSSIGRSILCFDTSDFEGATIEAAYIYFRLVGSPAKEDTLDMNPSVAVVSAFSDGETHLIPTDYQNLGTTPYSAWLPWGDISEDEWNLFTLNSAGIAAINKSGYSFFGIRMDKDISGVDPTWKPYPARVVCQSAVFVDIYLIILEGAP